MLMSQSTLRDNLIAILESDIRTVRDDEGLSFPVAATRVLLEWLGYNLEDVTFVDGQDRGIDAWLVTDSGIDVFQIKTHEQTPDDLLDLSTFDGKGVRDLGRASDFILSEQVINIQRKPLKDLLYRRDSLLHSRSLQNETTELPITFHLVILGDDLTEDGKAEFLAFQSTIRSGNEIGKVSVQLYASLHTVNNVIDAKWREDNRTWTDRNQRKLEEISLHPWNEGAITDNQNAIFYCKAIDLVLAYDALGYQLFEPNVRANIKTSRVNQAIRDSVLHKRTRREFRFLNNGVTIICDNFNLVKGVKRHFKVLRPGIVNGLQTVVALHTAYGQLTDEEKSDFEEYCSVLVRLLRNNAVDDVTRVVKSTNNQNPMKPRNLMSNTIEQLNYARIFAQDLGWFYEAKEGAWDAFDKDHKRWRPSLNRHPKEFRIPNSRSVRRVDNEDLAQIWLSFIGFAHEAINERKYLFDERFYTLIFKQQSKQHGFDYDFALVRAKEQAVNQSPSASLMLVAYLAREFAREITPSASENRERACARLGIDPKLPKTQLDAALSQDNEFVLIQALGGMSVLFTEFVGFVLFRACGEQVYHFGQRILQNHSFSTMAFDSFDNAKDRIYREEFDPKDILIILWFAFVDTIEDMLAGTWGHSYRAAPVKVRFTFSKETRERLYKEIQETNEFMKKRSLKKMWAVGVTEGQGLFEFIRECIS